jgi:hypothetical protein
VYCDRYKISIVQIVRLILKSHPQADDNDQVFKTAAKFFQLCIFMLLLGDVTYCFVPELRAVEFGLLLGEREKRVDVTNMSTK